MDLAEETFCETRTLPGNKLSKAQWREFTDIFIEGKKVSLRNVVKKVISADNSADPSRKTDTGTAGTGGPWSWTCSQQAS